MGENVSGNVLLVDDSPDLIDVIAEDLAGSGHRVAVAANGAQALDMAEHVPPDLALVDLRMPGLSGWEVARRLRARYGERILIVAYTGWSTPGDRARSVAAGFDRLLRKPATLVELRALAEEAITRSPRARG